jgi:hypothetical protein
MSIRFIIPIAVLVFSLLACTSQYNESKSMEVESTESLFEAYYNNNTLLDSLKSEMFEGNVNAYAELRDIYFLSEHRNEFLFYAFYMSDVHGFVDAREDLRFMLRKGTKLADSELARLLDSIVGQVNSAKTFPLPRD